MLMEEIEDLNNGDILCSWNGRLNIVNMSVFLKLTHTFKQTHVNFRIDKLILKFK